MIRWIDTTIGTAAFEDPDTAGLPILDVRGLVDGPANALLAIRERVETGLEMLRNLNRLVVCCDLGISRSNTIAAAILALRDGLSFDLAMEMVQHRLGERRMDFGIVQSVRQIMEPATEDVRSIGGMMILGATGFIGKNVSKLAKASGEEFFAADTNAADLASSPFSLDKLIRNCRPSVLVNLAYPRVVHSHEVVGTSLAMLRNVTDVCGHHGIFLVHASCSAVFSGLKNAAMPLDDDHPCEPYGNHSLAKALAEDMLRYLSRTASLPNCVLRFSPIYGPGGAQPRFLYRVAEQARAGNEVVTHQYQNGRPALQLLHVEDAAHAILLAAKKCHLGFFNIAGDESMATCEIAKRLVEGMGKPFRGREIKLEGSTARIVLDCTKARVKIGWRPCRKLEKSLVEVFS